ncbi:MAG: polysaccharide lyase [Rikenellaceae bacterium]|jgi:hypothetical protein|nr:polysaccharide lyase [Rikenellaceae bacterium]
MKCLKSVTAASLLLLLAGTVRAQYPTIPPERQAVGDSMLARADRASDAAFVRAMVVIRAEAMTGGRPYLPWSNRPSDLPQAELRAFPGAEGGGAFTAGGRGGKVITVTSLADNGPGTFREACETGGARIIVFNVAGVIRLETPISIRAPYVTIAGQTAPGDGVCITGRTVNIDTHDVIMRHMRFRRGNTGVTDRDDALGGEPIGNVIIDHVSASWGCDENLSAYRHMYINEWGQRIRLTTCNLTIQNCISSEGLDTYNHSFGSTLGGRNNTFVRNLYACNAGRNPSMASSEFNFINNVLFNWVHRTGDGAGYSYNVIGNYLKPGPATPIDKPIGHRIMQINGKGRTQGWLYAEGNYVEGFPAVNKDNWKGDGLQLGYEGSLTADESFIRAKAMMPMAPVTVMSAKNAYAYVLKNAGATLPRRDAVDDRVIRQVTTGEIEYVDGGDYGDILKDLVTLKMNLRLGPESYKLGIIYDPRQVGGLPEYTGTPYVDTDKDGMPDTWEIRYGLTPNDPSDAVGDLNGDGYTNIEKYINGIDPKKKVDWNDPKNNHDTLEGRKSLL